MKEISRGFIHFCLLNRSMYAVFITAKSSRVDEEEPDLEINKLRVGLFKLIIQVIQNCLSIDENEQLLTFTRIFFFNIQGIVATYSYPNEPIEVVMERLSPTFDSAVEVLLLGFKGKIKKGMEKI